MTHTLDHAIAELKRAPAQPVIAEIGGLIVELRCRARQPETAPSEEVGPAGLSYAEAMQSHLSRAPVPLKKPDARYPRREELHDRSGLR